MTKMQQAVFNVGDVPYAVWEWDVRERNLEFIRQIDEKYFEYLAQVHFESIEGKDRDRAALALRAAYHHAIETLMVLIGATVQAPHCYPGWILKAPTGAVRAVVRSLSQLAPPIPSVLDLPVLTWESLAGEVFRFAGWGAGNADTAERFAQAWHMLAHEWLDQTNIDEYNGIKHGLRAKQGGFTLAVGRQDDPGTPAPPERMRSVGGSEFGSRFFLAEGIAGAPPLKADPHFRLRRMSLNWNPVFLVRAMQLVSMSISNLKSFALIVNREPPSTVQFIRPAESSFYDDLWIRPGVTSLSMDSIVSEPDIRRSTRDELKKFLEEYNNKMQNR
jgi:hypothetical protein